jgi:hypothetical protein
MNKSVSIKTLGVGLVAALVVGAFVGYSVMKTSGYKFGTYPVKLSPDNGSDVLLVAVEDSSKECKKDKHAGCMLFGEDNVGTVKFYLDGSKFKTKSCKNSNKVITKIELTTTGAGNKGVFNDGLGWVQPDKWLKENAFPSVDLTTGIAYEATDLDQARSLVFLSNMNNHDASEGTKTFWYRVTVSDCDADSDEGPWVSDPRGDNEGTNF